MRECPTCHVKGVEARRFTLLLEGKRPRCANCGAQVRRRGALLLALGSIPCVAFWAWVTVSQSVSPYLWGGLATSFALGFLVARIADSVVGLKADEDN